MKKMKGLSKKQKLHRHRHQYGDYQMERCGGRQKRVKGLLNGDKRRLYLGSEIHNIIYRVAIFNRCAVANHCDTRIFETYNI